MIESLIFTAIFTVFPMASVIMCYSVIYSYLFAGFICSDGLHIVYSLVSKCTL